MQETSAKSFQPFIRTLKLEQATLLPILYLLEKQLPLLEVTEALITGAKALALTALKLITDADTLAQIKDRVQRKKIG